jgi:hypothetical protein
MYLWLVLRTQCTNPHQWHKSTYLLTQSFQQALDTFYPSDILRLLNHNADG